MSSRSMASESVSRWTRRVAPNMTGVCGAASLGGTLACDAATFGAASPVPLELGVLSATSDMHTVAGSAGIQADTPSSGARAPVCSAPGRTSRVPAASANLASIGYDAASANASLRTRCSTCCRSSWMRCEPVRSLRRGVRMRGSDELRRTPAGDVYRGALRVMYGLGSLSTRSLLLNRLLRPASVARLTTPKCSGTPNRLPMLLPRGSIASYSAPDSSRCLGVLSPRGVDIVSIGGGGGTGDGIVSAHSTRTGQSCACQRGSTLAPRASLFRPQRHAGSLRVCWRRALSVLCNSSSLLERRSPLFISAGSDTATASCRERIGAAGCERNANDGMVEDCGSATGAVRTEADGTGRTGGGACASLGPWQYARLASHRALRRGLMRRRSPASLLDLWSAEGLHAIDCDVSRAANMPCIHAWISACLCAAHATGSRRTGTSAASSSSSSSMSSIETTGGGLPIGVTIRVSLYPSRSSKSCRLSKPDELGSGGTPLTPGRRTYPKFSLFERKTRRRGVTRFGGKPRSELRLPGGASVMSSDVRAPDRRWRSCGSREGSTCFDCVVMVFDRVDTSGCVA